MQQLLNTQISVSVPPVNCGRMTKTAANSRNGPGFAERLKTACSAAKNTQEPKPRLSESKPEETEVSPVNYEQPVNTTDSEVSQEPISINPEKQVFLVESVAMLMNADSSKEVNPKSAVVTVLETSVLTGKVMPQARDMADVETQNVRVTQPEVSITPENGTIDGSGEKIPVSDMLVRTSPSGIHMSRPMPNLETVVDSSAQAGYEVLDGIDDNLTKSGGIMAPGTAKIEASDLKTSDMSQLEFHLAQNNDVLTESKPTSAGVKAPYLNTEPSLAEGGETKNEARPNNSAAVIMTQPEMKQDLITRNQSLIQSEKNGVAGSDYPDPSLKTLLTGGEQSGMGTFDNSGTAAQGSDLKTIMSEANMRIHGSKRIIAEQDQSITEDSSFQLPEVKNEMARWWIAAPEVRPEAGVAEKVEIGELVPQMVRKIQYLVQDNKSFALTIELKPEVLGKLNITLALQDGVLTARFDTENHQVKQVLEAGMGQLKSTLEQNGIRLEKTEVNVDLGKSGFFHGFDQQANQYARSFTAPREVWNGNIWYETAEAAPLPELLTYDHVGTDGEGLSILV